MLQGKKQILTIYFSRRGETPMDGELQTITKGHSEMVAESIQKAVGGDIFEIQPAIPYDESYEKCLIRARRELSGDERPELKAYPENFDQYDIIFLAFPNWLGALPMCVCTLLERLDFSGKILVPFCIEAGSGMGICDKMIRRRCQRADIKNGFVIHGSDIGSEWTRKEITKWSRNSIMGAPGSHLSEEAIAYIAKMFADEKNQNQPRPFQLTDPEFYERFSNFAFDEVIHHGNITDKTRWIAILSALIGSNSVELFQILLPAALNCGMTPVEVREVVYLSAPLVGLSETYPFLKAMNECFIEKGIQLPLPPQSRFAAECDESAGTQVLVDLLGETMRNFAATGGDTSYINRWKIAHYYGDYYTRVGLDYAQREIVTQCMLAAIGDVMESMDGSSLQVIHTKAFLNLGHDRRELLEAVSQCIPYIGYPKCIKAINAIHKGIAEWENEKKNKKNAEAPASSKADDGQSGGCGLC